MAGSSRTSARSRAASRRRRLGCETPRVFTPPLRELTPQTTLGFAAVEFAVEVCGIDLYPWQRWLLIHALELDPALTVDTMHERGRLDPLFRFRKIVVLVARQNGKSTLSQVLSLFFLYVLGTDLVLGTAQDLDTAEEVWEGALDIIEETPELAALADKPVRNNGKKAIKLLSGERYKVKAANRRAGRGLSGDLILLDELREHQSWDAWGAITKTTQARPAAQIWALSNAGDATSVVLRYLRKSAHAALGDPDGINADDDPAALLPTADDIEDFGDVVDDDLEPDDFEEDVDTLGLFEWSGPPGCDVTDRDAWAQANPSLGYGISERTIAGDVPRPGGGDPEWIFRPEVLCQWIDGVLQGPFPPGSWDAGTDPKSHRVPGSPQAACIDVSWDRSMTHIAFASLRADGKPHVEIAARRAGTEWVAGWLAERIEKHNITGVAVQARGAPASSLLEPLQEAGLPVVEWAGSDITSACGSFYDLVRAAVTLDEATGEPLGPGVYHLPQPPLDIAAGIAATKKSSDAWMWDRDKSPADISPLVAATGAVWLLLKPVEAPARSAYEDRGVLTI